MPGAEDLTTPAAVEVGGPPPTEGMAAGIAQFEQARERLVQALTDMPPELAHGPQNIRELAERLGLRLQPDGAYTGPETLAAARADLRATRERDAAANTTPQQAHERLPQVIIDEPALADNFAGILDPEHLRARNELNQEILRQMRTAQAAQETEMVGGTVTTPTQPFRDEVPWVIIRRVLQEWRNERENSSAHRYARSLLLERRWESPADDLDNAARELITVWANDLEVANTPGRNLTAYQLSASQRAIQHLLRADAAPQAEERPPHPTPAALGHRRYHPRATLPRNPATLLPAHRHYRAQLTGVEDSDKKAMATDWIRRFGDINLLETIATAMDIARDMRAPWLTQDHIFLALIFNETQGPVTDRLGETWQVPYDQMKAQLLGEP